MVKEHSFQVQESQLSDSDMKDSLREMSERIGGLIGKAESDGISPACIAAALQYFAHHFNKTQAPNLSAALGLAFRTMSEVYGPEDDDNEETSKQDEVTSGDEVTNRALLH